jgi:hypothetical protein
MSVGTSGTLGKSYLLQYLYALQECHFRGSTKTPLRIHSMPSIDLIGDFARESPLRGINLADVHTYDPSEELCEALVATLANSAALTLLHVSVKNDFSADDGSGRHHSRGMSDDLSALLMALSTGSGCPTVVLLLRDVDADDYGPQEQRRVAACIEMVREGLGSGPSVLAWLVLQLFLASNDFLHAVLPVSRLV